MQRRIINQVSVLISLIGVLFIVQINLKTQGLYLNSGSNGTAIFGLNFMDKLGYYAFGLVAMALPLYNLYKKYSTRLTWVALIFGFFTLVLNAVPLWQIGTGN